MNAGPAAHHLPFFVYGTLRPGQANHAWTLGGRTAAEEPALIRGALLYNGPGYPYAVAAPEEPGAGIHGELIHPREDAYAEVLAVLDRLEGYVPGGGDNLYERIAAEALRPDGSTVRAWVYVAAAPLAGRLRTSGEPIPGGDWLRAAAADRARTPIGPGAPATLDGTPQSRTPR